MTKYYLSTKLGDEEIEREVSLEQFCEAERKAGFRPKGISPSDPAYMTTPATGGFGIYGQGQCKGSVRHE